MKSFVLKGTVAAAIMMLGGGCALELDNQAGIDDQGMPSFAAPGRKAESIQQDGAALNSIKLSSSKLHGVSTQNAFGGGVSLSPLGLDGARLYGVAPSGSQVTGTALINARLTGILDNGGSLPLRIVDVVPSASDPEVERYWVQYNQGSVSKNLCGQNQYGDPNYAIPLEGIWNANGSHGSTPDEFTLACEDDVLAKCVNMGYTPWRSVEECDTSYGCQFVSMAPMHQACTRMMRADYCGDGTPHTVPGVEINVWDNFGIQKQDDTPTDFKFEADWTQYGARHIHHTRLGDVATKVYIEENCRD